MADRVRVIRITVIEGEREWVEETVNTSIQGTRIINQKKGNKITSMTLGNFPEIMEEDEERV